MASATLERALELRKKHPEVSAGTLIAWARNEGTIHRVPMDEGPGDAAFAGSTELDGFTLKVRWVPDWDAPCDVTFTDTWQEGAVQNPNWRPNMYSRDRVYRWVILPSGDEEGAFKWYHEHGWSKQAAREKAREQIREDLEAALSDEQRFYICLVDATKAGIELGHAALGGVDLGTDYSQAKEWAETLPDENGLLAEAVDEAKANLKELCCADA